MLVLPQRILKPILGLVTAIIGVGVTVGACSSSSPLLPTPESLTPSASVTPQTSVAAPAASQSPVPMKVEILQRLPFDATAFTQGLEVTPHGLLVSTGQYGESSVFYLENGTSRRNDQPIEAKYFGEGATEVNNTVWQLTWKAGVAFQRDADSLQLRQTVSYPGQGWGLCSFADTIIMSDGTGDLRLLDPETFAERSRVTVTNTGTPVSRLNELACTEEGSRRYVYANVFLSTDIYKIDVDSGAIVGLIDASSVPNNAVPDANHVLNGIANIPGTDHFYLTGKRWPDLYEVTFVNAS
ncbi:glutaminyl-peptide cyclotransferase [Corynebacterium sp. HS2168-gen11]|uniref:glutaminyl-peptide cyclotransferase n=1 Tax=Corynebacterium sp. HS2168-gen11 TaxID=2974027 RepID=UPI00216B49C3|nr:glutaminyl-peptide cyclotransferase [Corynebacterium sp. HS2168-gen11]MCS4536437.1 glutaminyl-peptide cyclotransferase [Corynebacterium sp. HS2168-gen11]